MGKLISGKLSRNWNAAKAVSQEKINDTYTNIPSQTQTMSMSESEELTRNESFRKVDQGATWESSLIMNESENVNFDLLDDLQLSSDTLSETELTRNVER